MRKEHIVLKNNASILIVEDSFAARVALENILSKLGAEADVAIDGEQAIEKTKIHNYQLILMDIGLPGKDGCEVTQFIRDWEKQHNLLPAYIIAQSSHLDQAVEKQCLAVGMNACYSKPLSLKTIENLIKIVFCQV